MAQKAHDHVTSEYNAQNSALCTVSVKIFEVLEQCINTVA